MKRLLLPNLLRRCVWPTIAWCFVLAGAHAEDTASVNPSDAVLLDFYADWCAPCRQMSATVDALVEAGYPVQRIDVDRQPSLAAKYAVQNIPCFVLAQQGQETDRIVGGCSYQQLEAMLARRLPTVRNPESVISNVKSQMQSPQSPTPAWRYERAIGHRAAIVRIYCQDGTTTRSIGSGTLVKWNGRLVILTARHVVKDAKRIVVELCTKRTHAASLIKADAVWDCAVLELQGDPVGVTPAELELGDAAMQREGDRLESCGYGPDGRLACNSGVFLGYRRSAAAAQGPDDWLLISGHARSGDSGGPVFNDRGRLVGVLWGTDGREVVGVQAGRIHQLLDAAVPQQKSLKIEQIAALPRNPTPAKEPGCTPPCPQAAAPAQEMPSTVGETASYGKKQPLLNWRGGAQKEDDRLDARIEALIALQERQARMATPVPSKPEPPAKEPEKAEINTDEASPAVAALCMLGAIGLAAAMYYLAAKEQ
jgi:thioredoxin 1